MAGGCSTVLLGLPAWPRSAKAGNIALGWLHACETCEDVRSMFSSRMRQTGLWPVLVNVASYDCSELQLPNPPQTDICGTQMDAL
jgi:hypothetical protein